jgi:hypothetical protein
LGCGREKVPESLGLDFVPQPGVDMVAMIESLPLASGSVSGMYALNVLEHLDNLPIVMGEIWRVLSPHGWCRIEVPYFTSVSAYADPTHRRWFTYTTFEHFGPISTSGWQKNRHTWFGRTHFRIRTRRLVFGRTHRLLGICWLANRFPAVYENLFAYWFPARALLVELSKIADS